MNISTGCDLVLISRFNPENKTLIKRFLNLNELKKLEEYKTIFLKQQFLASCWAVKEAVFKAIQLEYDYADFSIINENGQFVFKRFFKGFNLSYSISEEGDYCLALCLSFKE